ncbi:MFS transporter [Streptomyces sp. NPDC060184]|uniref:MFS transporter n=1 Tax=Streptomyces sp. NPDC060184 TaxID=3347064 RepID=UPI00365EB71A
MAVVEPPASTGYSAPKAPKTTTSAKARRARALTGISLGYFMVLLDTTVLSVAEPDLASSLGTSTAGLQWAVTGYTVAFAALLLSAGAAADRFGADRLFRCGVTVFVLASLLSSVAPGLTALLLLRALSGAAAAACVPASLAMIGRLYPEPAARARAISVWAAVSGAAVAAGPLAGGALVGAAGWRAVFWANVPVGLVALALTRTRSVACPRGDRPIDWPAQAAAAVALALLTDALIAAGARDVGHAVWSSAGFLLAALAFLVRERGSRSPVLNRDLLRSARVRAGLLAAAAVGFALAGALFVLPLLLQRQWHLSPLETGLVFLPLTVPFAANPPLTGRIVARKGPRLPVLTGLSLLTAGGAALAGPAFAGGSFLLLAPGLLLTGFGISFVLPALAAAVVGAAPEGTAGAAGGLLNAVRQVGATLGVALMGAVAAGHTGWSLLLSAGVCGLAGLVFAWARPGAGPRAARGRGSQGS